MLNRPVDMLTTVFVRGKKNNLLYALVSLHLQRSAKRDVRGLVKFVPAVAYLLCLALLG